VRSLTPIYHSLRLGIQTHVGRSPFLYQLLHRARNAPRSRNLVDPETDVCIEAPSGSGNSFFVQGFLMANPGVRVAHHHHVAAQVKRSVGLSLPTLVILRNPIDCSVSRSKDAPWMVGPVLRQWIRFFQTVEALEASVLRLSFELVTRDPGVAVERVNSRFGCAFEPGFPDAERIFAYMDEGWPRALDGPGPSRNPNRPDHAQAERKLRARPMAESHSLAGDALALYERLRRGLE
jgi:hypothetical protein